MTEVSRETPPPPPEAAGVFHARLPLAVAYADRLAGDGILRGLIGPREVPRLWERHLLNCAALTELIPEGVTVADVGSGAGLPGMVLAICRPDLQVTLIEPLLRRSTFLEEVVEDLGLDNVEVVRSRADALHHSRTFDIVTSRAVANLTTLLSWCVPLADFRGQVLALKGRSAAEEIAAAKKMVRQLRCGVPEVVLLEPAWLSDPVTVVRVEATRPPR